MATRASNTNSIFGRLLKLPDATLVYPAHDYKGDNVSTIAEEKAFNPRLQVKSVEEYVELMNNLKLANPKMMDVAVPANIKIGMHQDEIARCGWAVTAQEALDLVGRPDVALVDLRERSRTRTQWRHPGRASCALPKLAGKHRAWELNFHRQVGNRNVTIGDVVIDVLTGQVLTGLV